MVRRKVGQRLKRKGDAGARNGQRSLWQTGKTWTKWQSVVRVRRQRLVNASGRSCHDDDVGRRWQNVAAVQLQVQLRRFLLHGGWRRKFCRQCWVDLKWLLFVVCYLLFVVTAEFLLWKYFNFVLQYMQLRWLWWFTIVLWYKWMIH